ncbi:hypothetical protein ACFL0D_09030 [Thermoproteota archaeon]
MSEEIRKKIMKTAVVEYPEHVGMKDFIDSTQLNQEELIKHVKYLEEKGFLKVIWTSSDFFVEATIYAIEYLGEEILSRSVIKLILENLYEKYPDYEKNDTMVLYWEKIGRRHEDQ